MVNDCRSLFAPIASGELDTPLKLRACLHAGLLEAALAAQESDPAVARLGYERSIVLLDRILQSPFDTPERRRCLSVKPEIQAKRAQLPEH
jgi:hypothetical protein